MSLLMLEGFDCYGPLNTTWNNANLGVAIQRNWDTQTGSGSGYSASGIIFASGFGPGFAMGMYSDSGNSQYIQRNFGSVHPTVILHCSYLPTGSTGNANHAIFWFYDSAGTEMGRLYYTGGGGQLIYRNGSGTTILTTTLSGGWTLNVWHTVEIMVTAGTTTGYVEIHIDGTLVGSATNVNTVGTALTTGMQSLALGAKVNSANFNNSQWDHLVVMDNTGTALNGFIGPKRVATLTPNGAGSHTAWTPTGAAANYNCVNEQGIDQDTTYNAAATVGTTDSYALSELQTTTQAVYAVQVTGHVKRDDTVTTRAVQLMVRSGGTDALVGASTLTATAYTTRLVAVLPTNPVTSAAWTNSDVAGLEAGIQVTA